MSFQNQGLVGIFVLVVILLAIPFIAMRFTNEVRWSLTDFVIAGVLLLGTGLICEVVLRKVKALKYRLILCAAILFVLFIVWAELAVGLIGTRFAGN